MSLFFSSFEPVVFTGTEITGPQKNEVPKLPSKLSVIRGNNYRSYGDQRERDVS